MRSKTAILVGISALIGAAAFFAVISSTKPSAPAQVVHKLDKVRVANIGEFSIFNIIAKEKDFFEKNDLNVELTEYADGGTSMGALRSGAADFAVAADFVGVRNIFMDDGLRILATASSHQTFQVLARRDKGIAVPTDLGGRTVGVTAKTAGEYYLGRFLTANGMGYSDVTVVDLSPVDLVTRFEAGQLDAIVIFDPHAYRLHEKLGNLVMTWSAQGDQRANAVVYTTSSLLETRPDVAERYVQSLADAAAFERDHAEEARSIVGRALKYDDAYLAYMWPKFNFGVRLDQELLLSMEAQSRWLIANGLTDKREVPNYLQFISFDPLDKVAPAAVTITH